MALLSALCLDLYIIFPFILAFKTSFFQEATVYQNQFQWQNTDRRNVVEKAKTAGFPTQLQAGYNCVLMHAILLMALNLLNHFGSHKVYRYMY